MREHVRLNGGGRRRSHGRGGRRRPLRLDGGGGAKSGGVYAVRGVGLLAERRRWRVGSVVRRGGRYPRWARYTRRGRAAGPAHASDHEERRDWKGLAGSPASLQESTGGCRRGHRIARTSAAGVHGILGGDRLGGDDDVRDRQEPDTERDVARVVRHMCLLRALTCVRIPFIRKAIDALRLPCAAACSEYGDCGIDVAFVARHEGKAADVHRADDVRGASAIGALKVRQLERRVGRERVLADEQIIRAHALIAGNLAGEARRAERELRVEFGLVVRDSCAPSRRKA
jgi:hypothetical protein